MEYQGVKYSVDMVLCIDATGSMSPVIEKVKSNALSFHGDVEKALAEKGKHFNGILALCKSQINKVGFKNPHIIK
ncbi:MAG: hypothetical protein LBG80_01590 [Bacteroidales bacterium]|jgi:hypothetical protein|nr:hypothetical protein [Bacteroidales bacterium]